MKKIAILLALLGTIIVPGLQAMGKDKIEINKNLIDAVVRNDVAAAEEALKDGANANAKYLVRNRYFNPILLATHNPAMVILLLHYGADINALNGLKQTTALMSACEFRKLDLVTLLLKNKANASLCMQNGRATGANALYVSCIATKKSPPTDASKQIIALILLHTNYDELCHTYSRIDSTIKEMVPLYQTEPALMLSHLDGVRCALHHAIKKHNDRLLEVVVQNTPLPPDRGHIVIQYLDTHTESRDVPKHPLLVDEKPTDEDLKSALQALATATEQS